MSANAVCTRQLRLGLMALGFATAAAAVDGPAPPLTATSRKADDVFEVKGDLEKAFIDVRSPSGIGRAVIGRTTAWPKAVVLRFRLAGLEQIRVSNQKQTTWAAVSVREGKPEVRRWKGDKEEAVGPGDPLWMGIRLLDADEKPASYDASKKGIIEVTLPAALFEGDPRGITVDWIDFFRN